MFGKYYVGIYQCRMREASGKDVLYCREVSEEQKLDFVLGVCKRS